MPKKNVDKLAQYATQYMLCCAGGVQDDKRARWLYLRGLNEARALGREERWLHYCNRVREEYNIDGKAE